MAEVVTREVIPGLWGGGGEGGRRGEEEGEECKCMSKPPLHIME